MIKTCMFNVCVAEIVQLADSEEELEPRRMNFDQSLPTKHQVHKNFRRNSFHGFFFSVLFLFKQ